MASGSSLTLKRGPAGLWHDTIGAELSGTVIAATTALAFYIYGKNKGDPEPFKNYAWPGIKTGMLLGAAPYTAGAMVGSMTGHPSTKEMDAMEERDVPSYLIPGRGGYRSGKRIRYLLELARKNKKELDKAHKLPSGQEESLPESAAGAIFRIGDKPQ
jgi:hypothetical protein